MPHSLGDEWFQNLFEYSPIPIEIYDGLGKLQTVNTACLELFGVKTIEEIKGFNLFKDPNLPKGTKSKLIRGKTVKYTSTFDFELVKKQNLYNTIKSGIIYVEVLIKPLFFSKDKLTPSNYAVYVQNITNRRLGELEKSDFLERLQERVEEKDLLMKEIHHRVKNNLQVISSLIILQNHSIKDAILREKFKDLLNRIKSISLNHDYLFSSEHLGKIDFKKYTNKLCENILKTYEHQYNGVQIRIDAVELFLNVKEAQVYGMILNELITNALKHAFPDKQGNITISFFQEENNSRILLVKDDGIGLPDQSNSNSTESLGLPLVKNLVRQINGKLEIINNKGTEIRISTTDL
ncbi:histidine kinase dimerization/phosphoacceptor domain -containing protein [Candidatus Lokiarchaeum ossiferum]|uniref:histidine kinase dimerization/phosphoacceptor domain -containing protein n=1 Tax=Candidatus Lokiarchaeum ossiferum TaxID=2951803 RepID=UPI00352CB8B5